MAVKRTGQMSLVEAFLGEGLIGSGRLDPLSKLVKWYRFEKLLEVGTGLKTQSDQIPPGDQRFRNEWLGGEFSLLLLQEYIVVRKAV